MAKSNGIGTNSFNEDLNLLVNLDSSEPINVHLEKSSPIVPSVSHPINTPGSVTNIERYDEKHDKVALNHLKAHIIGEIKNELNLKSAQNDSSHNEYIVALYKSEIYFLRDEMKQKIDIIKNALNMKQVQIENSSSINAIKLRQDIKNAISSSVFENIKEKIFTDFDIKVDTPKKKSFNDQKNENEDNINKLNDINIKLSSNNNFPNKCKTMIIWALIIIKVMIQTSIKLPG